MSTDAVVTSRQGAVDIGHWRAGGRKASVCRDWCLDAPFADGLASPLLDVLLVVGWAAWRRAAEFPVTHRPRPAERVPTRATRTRQRHHDDYLAGELRWRLRKAVEGAGASRMVSTPSEFSDAVLVVLRTQLRPFTRLTVRLRDGQDLSDLVAVQHRLRDLMGANGIHIAPLAAYVVTIDLW